MPDLQAIVAADQSGLYPTDEEVVRRVAAGELPLFEILMRRYNQRLFRVARSIVRSFSEAEDVVQQAYVSCYQNLMQFSGRASFSTWLTRIAIHEALARVRAGNRRELAFDDEYDVGCPLAHDPEQQAANRELARLFEEACDCLPEIYRTVLMMRGIEEMSTSETARCLDVSEETVKVRLHRARFLLRQRIDDQVEGGASEAFAFLGVMCDRIVERVSARILAMAARV